VAAGDGLPGPDRRRGGGCQPLDLLRGGDADAREVAAARLRLRRDDSAAAAPPSAVAAGGDLAGGGGVTRAVPRADGRGGENELVVRQIQDAPRGKRSDRRNA